MSAPAPAVPVTKAAAVGIVVVAAAAAVAVVGTVEIRMTPSRRVLRPRRPATTEGQIVNLDCVSHLPRLGYLFGSQLHPLSAVRLP